MKRLLIAHPLRWLIILGALLRILFSLISHHIYYPDEIFQTLELSYRLVHGYGMITWDVAYGLRSWLVAGIYAVPLYVMNLCNLTNPAIYTRLEAVCISLLSLPLIPAGYLLTLKLTRQKRPSLLVAFALAVWYELIYFAPRALTEVLSVNLYSFSLMLLLISKPKYFAAAFFGTLALLLRPQYFLIFLVIWWWQKRSLKLHSNYLLGGVLTALLCIGFTDYAAYGTWFIHLYRNFLLSFQLGISRVFGTTPWPYYLIAVLAGSGGLVILAALASQTPRYRPAVWVWLGVLLIHVLIAHKEYRFLYATIPLTLVLAVPTLDQLIRIRLSPKNKSRSTRVIILVIVILSLLGISDRLPGQYAPYPEPPLFSDPQARLLAQIPATVCAVYSANRPWVYSGGYYWLGQPAPFYDATLNPPITTFNYLLTTDPLPERFQKQDTAPAYTIPSAQGPLTFPAITLAARPGPCQPHPYSIYRSFSSVESILSTHHVKPVLKPSYATL